MSPVITSTHIILNTAILGRKKYPERNWPLVLGSLLPDLPMIFYFFAMVFIHGRWDAASRATLNEYHFRQFWVDAAHSIPIALAGLLLCLVLKSRFGLYFFAAMGLHNLEDLPLHAEYSHRHFFPLSDYRFFSPISYADPHYHAAVVAPLEWAVIVFCVCLLWKRGLKPWVQLLLLSVCVVQGLWLVYCYSGWRWPFS
jgi:hypothetical protein